MSLVKREQVSVSLLQCEMIFATIAHNEDIQIDELNAGYHRAYVLLIQVSSGKRVRMFTLEKGAPRNAMVLARNFRFVNNL